MMKPLSPQLLSLAALDDILNVVLPIIFMVLWVVGQLLTKKKRAQQKGGQPPRPVVPPGPQGVDKPVGLEAALRKEVDEFLRRAQGGPIQDQPPRKQETTGKKLPRQGRKTTVGRETAALDSTRAQGDRAEHRPLPSQIAKQRSGLATTVPRPSKGPAVSSVGGVSAGGLSSAAMRSAQPVDNLRSQSVNAHVADHIDRGRQAIGRQAERLADELEQTDERAQKRIEQKFEHQVGRLQHQDEVVVAQKVGLAEEIAELLRSPDGMRQFIIAKEILDRPFQ